MLTCPSCGRECLDDFAFCPGCGTKLVGEAAGAATDRATIAADAAQTSDAVTLAEERKVVTTLFCDLVSFTAHSEVSDHELIDGLLQRYDALAKQLVESHGGVVEKYIGDAVVAVFGFPSAHDDDAERAVRCGFRLVEEAGALAWPDGDPVAVHIGVNSGEIYLHTDVDPSSGQSFLTGDAVNTAARLEAASPANGIVVGELTRGLTDHAIVYDELEPLTVKGKKEPVRAWLAKGLKQARSRTGLRTTGKVDTPFLGRDAELRTLEKALDAAVSNREARFVLLVGEPGIGKSRLVLEFAHALDERPELITWRQGRCLAYGDGSGFSALSDILKAHARIFDSDEVAAVEEKLEAVLPDGNERSWLRQRLRLLLGLEAAPASREESFTAWTRFLQHVASAGPTVLVLEDLHWASEGMLAFIEHLATQELEAPLLIIATTRPELLTVHPETLVRTKSGDRLVLSPLTRKDASHLVSVLLDERIAAGVRTPIVERVGGNPLYAEEYVRLLLDRGLLLKTKGVLQLKKGAELPLPDSVQAVLQARLDTLAAEHKAVLCDAAIFGESFWDGGVAALAGRDPAGVRATMAVLGARQFIRPASVSSLAGETEYLFWHALARDVAYAGLPKRARLHKHQQAAEWVEGKAGERTDDVAEVLAHHFVTAHSLGRELGDRDGAAAIAPQAGHYLWRAATRNRAIAGEKARQQLEQALDLLPADASERPQALFLLGEEISWDMPKGAIPRFREALPGLRSAGPRNAAAGCAVQLASCLLACGADGWEPLTREAFELVDEEHPTPELVYALQELSGMAALAGGDDRVAVDLADRALSAAAALDLPAPGALAWRGAARSRMGDQGGLEDLEHAIEQARAWGSTHTMLLHQNNYASCLSWWKGSGEALRVLRVNVARAKDAGMELTVLESGMNIAICLADLGRWDEAQAEIERLLPLFVEADIGAGVALLRSAQAALLLQQGNTDGAAAIADALLRAARLDVLQPIQTVHCYAGAAYAEAVRGRTADARALLAESLRVGDWLEFADAGVVRLALACGDADLAERLRNRFEPLTPLYRHVLASCDALLAEARGEHEAAAAGFADAAARWREFGVPYEEAQALLGEGRCLVALERAPEAAPVLEQAREILERLGARPALAETETLLASARGTSAPRQAESRAAQPPWANEPEASG